MKASVLWSIGLLAFSITEVDCHARLGETLEKSIARFGQPYLQDANPPPGTLGDKLAAFRKNGYNILMVFLDDKVAMEDITKINGDDFTNNEVETLLSSESDSKNWTKDVQEMGLTIVYLRSDYRVSAMHALASRSFTFSSFAYLNAQAEEKRKLEKQKLKDF